MAEQMSTSRNEQCNPNNFTFVADWWHIKNIDALLASWSKVFKYNTVGTITHHEIRTILFNFAKFAQSHIISFEMGVDNLFEEEKRTSVVKNIIEEYARQLDQITNKACTTDKIRAVYKSQAMLWAIFLRQMLMHYPQLTIETVCSKDLVKELRSDPNLSNSLVACSIISRMVEGYYGNSTVSLFLLGLIEPVPKKYTTSGGRGWNAPKVRKSLLKTMMSNKPAITVVYDTRSQYQRLMTIIRVIPTSPDHYDREGSVVVDYWRLLQLGYDNDDEDDDEYQGDNLLLDNDIIATLV